MADAPISEAENRRPPRKLPRKMTRERLGNIAKFHVERFATTTGQLRVVLLRRIDRAVRIHGGDAPAMKLWVDEVIAGLVRAGGLDDARFALSRAQALRQRGKTPARIRVALLTKGVPRELIDAAIADSARDNDADLAAAAALAYAKRRRLGSFRVHRTKPDAQELRRLQQKDLAALVRAGFAFDIARRTLTESHD